MKFERNCFRLTTAERIFGKIQSKVTHKAMDYIFNYREHERCLTCLSRMPVMSATNLASFVMTFAACHSPAVHSCLLAYLFNIESNRGGFIEAIVISQKLVS